MTKQLEISAVAWMILSSPLMILKLIVPLHGWLLSFFLLLRMLTLQEQAPGSTVEDKTFWIFLKYQSLYNKRAVNTCINLGWSLCFQYRLLYILVLLQGL